MVKRNRLDTFKKELSHPTIVGWRALMELFKVTLTQLEERLGDYGCSTSRFQTLFFLYMDGPQAPVELSRKLVVTRGNITGLLKRMQDDGLIKFVKTKDSKRDKVELTKKGVNFIEKIFPEHTKNVKTILPDFPQEVINFLQEAKSTVDS